MLECALLVRNVASFFISLLCLASSSLPNGEELCSANLSFFGVNGENSICAFDLLSRLTITSVLNANYKCSNPKRVFVFFLGCNISGDTSRTPKHRLNSATVLSDTRETSVDISSFSSRFL